MKVITGEKYRQNSCSALIVEVIEVYKNRSFNSLVIYRQRATQHTISLNAFKEQFTKVK